MPRFTVRIELHDDHNGSTYERLNRAMEAKGFSRLIRTQEGTRYELPTAEYRISGQRTRAQVCRLAKASAAQTATDAAILVTEGDCSFLNLRSPSAKTDGAER